MSLSFAAVIEEELGLAADVMRKRGIRNKHDMGWNDWMEYEFANWLVNKFIEESRVFDNLAPKRGPN